MGQPFVMNTRKTLKVNTLPSERVQRRLIVDQHELHRMNDTDSVIDMRPNTQLGRRRAYAALLTAQRSLPAAQEDDFDDSKLITMYLMLTHYNITQSKQAPQHPTQIDTSVEEVNTPTSPIVHA